MMNLMLLTGDPEYARRAQDCGIDRIFVDLEYINKTERQRGRNTYITQYTLDSIAPVRSVLKKSKLLVRVNPIHSNSKMEIDRAIEEGADMLMLPMAYDAHDVETFISMVDGRAYTIPMIETSQAMVHLDDILAVKGIDELFIGLNDLHISLGLSFMFEPLSGGIVEYMGNKINSVGLPWGFGGIAKIGEGLLPAEKIIGEHYRLGSTTVILSRTFRNEVDAEGKKVLDLNKEIKKIRRTEKEIIKWEEKKFIINSIEVRNCVNKIISK